MLVAAITLVLACVVVAYGVFAGADFGGGFWDLCAGRGPRATAARRRIDKSIGPVWEANHVWLVFVLVITWTAFPHAFAQALTGLFVPLFGAALGIVLRGGAFVLRKSSTTFGQARLFGALFATSSVLTPFLFGAAVGAAASGRVPAEGVPVAWAWLAPTSLLGGVLAVGCCAWLASVWLAADARRDGQAELAGFFSARARWSGAALAVVSLAGIPVLAADAPTLAARLATLGAPLVGLAALSGGLALWHLQRGRPDRARVPAASAVATILGGWAVAQFPWILVDELTLADAAAEPAVLRAVLVASVVCALLVLPALTWLLWLTRRGALSASAARADSSEALLERES